VLGGAVPFTTAAQSQPWVAANAEQGTRSSDKASAGIPEVVYKHGQLAIFAQNCSLNEILDAIHTETGAVVEAPSLGMDSKVAVHLGPGDPMDVLADLLDRSVFSYIIVSGSARTIERIILMPVPAFEPPLSTDPTPAVPIGVDAASAVAPVVPTAEEKQVPDAPPGEVEEKKIASPARDAEDKTMNAALPDSASAPIPSLAAAGTTTNSNAAVTQESMVATSPDSASAATPDIITAPAPSADAKVAQDSGDATTQAAATESGNENKAPGDSPAQAADHTDASLLPTDAPVPSTDQTPPAQTADASPGPLPVLVPSIFSANPAQPASDESIPNPAMERPVSSSPQANSGTGGGSNSNSGNSNSTSASLNNGGTVSVPGIPQEILNEICQYYGGSCPEVVQKLNNEPTPTPVQVCPRIIINRVTQGASCAN
jgi:hypothetical protein